MAVPDFQQFPWNLNLLKCGRYSRFSDSKSHFRKETPNENKQKHWYLKHSPFNLSNIYFLSENLAEVCWRVFYSCFKTTVTSQCLIYFMNQCRARIVKTNFYWLFLKRSYYITADNQHWKRTLAQNLLIFDIHVYDIFNIYNFVWIFFKL